MGRAAHDSALRLDKLARFRISAIVWRQKKETILWYDWELFERMILRWNPPAFLKTNMILDLREILKLCEISLLYRIVERIVTVEKEDCAQQICLVERDGSLHNWRKGNNDGGQVEQSKRQLWEWQAELKKRQEKCWQAERTLKQAVRTATGRTGEQGFRMVTGRIEEKELRTVQQAVRVTADLTVQYTYKAMRMVTCRTWTQIERMTAGKTGSLDGSRQT